MKFKVTGYTAPKFSNSGTGFTEQLGLMLSDALNTKGQGKMLREQFGITFKEDVTTTTGAGAYTTMLSTTLYEAAIQNIQDILGTVNINDDLKNKGGFGAYQIPILEPTVAVEVAEGAVISYFDEGVTSVTVTARKVVAGTAITWEMLKRGMTDFVKYVLQNAADAISRKLATDIVNGLASAAGFDETGGMTYDNIIDAKVKIQSAKYDNTTPYGFMADAMIITETAYGTLQKTTEWKNTVFFANIRPGDKVEVARQSFIFNGLRIIPTPFLTGALAVVLDTRKAAMLVRESDLETFEGSINGRPYDREVVALMSYVLAVIYTSAICTINT